MNILNLPVISIDKEKGNSFNDLIAKLNSSYRPGDEVEIRIRPSIDYEEFQSLLTYFRNESNVKELQREITFVQGYKKMEMINDRKFERTYREVFNKGTNQRIFQYKNQKKYATLETYPYGFKVALSQEITFKDGDKILNKQIYNEFTSADKDNYIKHQIRYKFNVKNEYEIHLSIISQAQLDVNSGSYETDILQSENVQYDVEIESIRDSLVKSNNYIQIFKFIMNIMTKRISIMSTITKQQLLNDTNTMINTIHQENDIRIMKSFDRFQRQEYVIFDNKPHSLYYDNIRDLLNSQFNVTNKLDGVYYNLIVTENFVVLVNSVDIEYLIGKNTQKIQLLKKTLDLSSKKYHIFVGELWNNTFNIFDAIVVNGEFVANNNHPDRLKDAYKISEVLSNVTIPVRVKSFFYSGTLTGNLLQDINKTLQNMKTTYGDDYEKNNDGIIFTQVFKGFMEKTFKWKFPHKISVDAKIKLESFTPTKKKFAMLFRNQERQIVPLEKPVFLEIDNSEPLFMALRDGLIVEISWDNKFKADRIRYDKNMPNKIDTAQNTIIQMKNPLTLEKLKSILESGEVPQENLMQIREGRDEKPYREYCNTVKNLLLRYTVKEGANVIDLGAGAGGDLYKYRELKPNKLFFVEPDEDHLEEMNRRINKEKIDRKLENRDFADKIVPIKAVAEDTKMIRESMKKAGFAEDITNINMMFSLTFFGTRQKLKDLVQTLNMLKNNGTFLSIYMDGDRTLELLRKNNGIIQGSYYKIEDLSPEKTRRSNYKLDFDHKIRFSFKGVTVTEEGQVEYLIPIDEFRKTLKKIPPGFNLLSTHIIDNPNNIKSNDETLLSQLKSQFQILNEEDKLLLSLYRFDIYQKTLYEAIERQQQQEELKLNSLEIDDQEEIKLKFEQPSDTFYRIGVIGDGSCFVHSFLFSLFRENYTALTENQRKKFAESVRKRVANSIDLQTWTELGNGNVAIALLQERIIQKLSNADQEIFDKLYIETQNEKPDNFLETLLEKVDEKFPKLNLFSENGLVQETYNKFIKELENPKFWINNYYIESFSNFFDINIIIVKDITRDIFSYAEYKNDKQSIMIFNIDPVHFESLVYEKNDEYSFIFTPQDELMQRLFVKGMRPEIKSVTIEVETPVQEREEREEIEEENLDDIKTKITDIVNDYFLFTKKTINFEII
jgi:hypothetical protein